MNQYLKRSLHNFGTQNTVNEIQDRATHDKRNMETQKEQIITNLVKSHGNKTRKRRNRNRRKRKQMDTLGNLKQVLKNLKQRRKQKKKRGNSKLCYTVGSEPLLKLSQKHISLKKLANGKCIRNKSLQNESKFKKQQTHQGNLRSVKNIRNRRKSKKQRNKFTVDRNQWRSRWCKTVLEKSVKEPKRTKEVTGGMVTWVNIGADQTREAKEIAMRVMVIRIMRDKMMIITKATFM